MAEDSLRYDAMLEAALRSVVRSALLEVAARGLPGEHHFYITFRTEHPGVRLPGSLRARYPDEMTIVIQHRFRDLEVGDDAFAITLSFSDMWQTLAIPFAAVTRFEDPSVNFGLQFKFEADEDGEEVMPADDGERAAAGNGADDARPETSDGDAAADAAADDGTDKVVALDRFRKK